MAYILTPLVAVTWLAFWSQEIPTFPPEGYTLSWFTVALRQDRFVNGFLTSLQVGVAAMLLGLLVGVLGALTTYSALMLECLLYSRSARGGLLLGYLGITLVGGLTLVWTGARLAHMLRPL